MSELIHLYQNKGGHTSTGKPLSQNVNKVLFWSPTLKGGLNKFFTTYWIVCTFNLRQFTQINGNVLLVCTVDNHPTPPPLPSSWVWPWFARDNTQQTGCIPQTEQHEPKG